MLICDWVRPLFDLGVVQFYFSPKRSSFPFQHMYSKLTNCGVRYLLNGILYASSYFTIWLFM
ncbi:hypothetical protein P167DRAFT_180288 [Morchella conica CCBAS932]|uniref:Uncharacterized protein n=1 Tax=Morchella conica CCBAS932 TaxID=1392247 RepID=A0A3N4KMR3_9PEZI|nr:hypothetical protein P167DRAFT_180288 [Morchella conica CCBAS932]